MRQLNQQLLLAGITLALAVSTASTEARSCEPLVDVTLRNQVCVELLQGSEAVLRATATSLTDTNSGVEVELTLTDTLVPSDSRFEDGLETLSFVFGVTEIVEGDEVLAVVNSPEETGLEQPTFRTLHLLDENDEIALSDESLGADTYVQAIQMSMSECDTFLREQGFRDERPTAPCYGCSASPADETSLLLLVIVFGFLQKRRRIVGCGLTKR